MKKSVKEILIEGEGVLTYKGKKYKIKKINSPPCNQACPISQEVKTYLGLIREKEYQKAWEVVKKTNPLPRICGRVCVRLCERECKRKEIDQPVSICALKRFITDAYLPRKIKNKKNAKRKEKIAIIGSGPAGLTAAHDLVKLGYDVTIFEKLPSPGGMLVVGIPPYRLPRKIIEEEIDELKQMGVKIKTSKKIEKITELKKEGYKAIFVAIGAHKGLKLNIPGEEEYEGVIDCVRFLQGINMGPPVEVGEKVVVIGGGNAAIDSARSAIRLGKKVMIIYRRTRKEMPANPWEVEEALEEGVEIHFLISPKKIIGKNGKVVGIECIRNKLGPPDSSGRRRPVPIEGTEFVIPADTIVPAISQEPDISFLKEEEGFTVSKWNSFVVEEKSLATNVEGVFAGGDCVTGPKTVVEAILAGHKGARSIHTYITGEEEEEKGEKINKIEWEIDYPYPQKERIEMPKLSLEERKNNFNEVELGLEEEEAVEEAKRCMRCGGCFYCEECVKGCEKKIVSIEQEVGKGVLVKLAKELEIPKEEKYKIENEEEEIEVRIEEVGYYIDEKLCRRCRRCEEVCTYSIPMMKEIEGEKIVTLDQKECKGCGMCVVTCPVGAIRGGHFSKENIEKMIEIGVK